MVVWGLALSCGIVIWHYGVLRADASGAMTRLLPAGILRGGEGLECYEDRGGEVELSFEDGNTETADVVVGADDPPLVTRATARPHHALRRAAADSVFANRPRDPVFPLGDLQPPFVAIEDGHFLGRSMAGGDLRDGAGVSASFTRFENERVAYANHHVESARGMGYLFHHTPGASRPGGGTWCSITRESCRVLSLASHEPMPRS
ncbi:MAG: hypothetical protein O3A63_11040 [Proteobacteria bacterium]|nr:hypothetical protein [Pseudomonadota bacterium]